MFESSIALFKATQIKRDESDIQSLTKVLYHQKTFQRNHFSAFVVAYMNLVEKNCVNEPSIFIFVILSLFYATKT